MSTQDAIDQEREQFGASVLINDLQPMASLGSLAFSPECKVLIARLSALIYHAYAHGDLVSARRWEAVRQDLLAGKVGEWCFFVETQELAA